MKTAVRYFSRSGNTKKLADAVAAAAGTTAESIEKDLPEKADIVFLGNSLYAGKYDPAVEAFLNRNADKIGLLVSFGSSASGKTTLKKLTAYAETKRIRVCDKAYNCPGHFLFLHKDRPNENDCKEAAAFATKILESCK